MNFYEQLQLNAEGSKKLIKEASFKKEKLLYSINFIIKVISTILFCVLFVSIYTSIFGQENGVAGVVLLLFLLTFRKVHFGYNLKHSIISMLLIFIILSFGPYLANISGRFLGMFINIFSIFMILSLGCYKVEFYNHATLILSYLLLYGSYVSGRIFYLRIISLILGGIWVSFCLYRNHKSKEIEDSILDVKKNLFDKSKNSFWKIKLALAISISMYLGSIFHFKKVMWIGIATMSILTPFTIMRKDKMLNRLFGTILGSILFLIIILILPNNYYAYIGILGGILVGFASSYRYQTIFNALGALSMAMAIYGRNEVIFIRIMDNIFAVVFVLIFSKVFDYLIFRKIDFNEDVVKI